MNRKIKQIIVCMTVIICGIFSMASAEIIDRIVAIVNNDIITLSELNKATKPYKANLEASQKSDEEKEKIAVKIDDQMLQQLIDRSLTAQQAAKYNISVSQKDIDSAVKNFKESKNLNQEQLEQALAEDDLTYKDYRAKMKSEILQSRLISRAVQSQVIITDNDIKTYYDAHGELFAGAKKYHLRNIVMDAEAGIQAVEKKLAGNISFDQLAKQYSQATNASDGGDLGVFDINNFSEEIKNSLQTLEKGDHTPILMAGQGYQILYVEDVVMEGKKTLEQARDQIENILYKEKAEKRFAEWIESLKKNAHIKIML
jgi:peptidyl-prolyl cis-trans isomerase SurA